MIDHHRKIHIKFFSALFFYEAFEYLRMEVSWRCNKSFVKISYCFDIPRLFNALTNDKKQTYTLYIVVNMKYYSMTWYHNYKPTHFLRKVVELFLRHRAFYHEISKVVCFWFIFDWIQIVVISEQICFTSVWNSLKYIEKLVSLHQSVFLILYDVILSICIIYIDLYLIKACVKRNKFSSQMFAWKMVKCIRWNENGFVFRCHWLSSFLDVCVWSINLQIFQFLSSYGWWRILKFMQRRGWYSFENTELGWST